MLIFTSYRQRKKKTYCFGVVVIIVVGGAGCSLLWSTWHLAIPRQQQHQYQNHHQQQQQQQQQQCLLDRAGAAATASHVAFSTNTHSANNCTAQVLTSVAAHNSNSIKNGQQIGWKQQKQQQQQQHGHHSNESYYYWTVTEQAQRDCNLMSPDIMPLSSTAEEIDKVLHNRWIILMGDSSTRMLHDYLVARWLGSS